MKIRFVIFITHLKLCFIHLQKCESLETAHFYNTHEFVKLAALTFKRFVIEWNKTKRDPQHIRFQFENQFPLQNQSSDTKKITKLS